MLESLKKTFQVEFRIWFSDSLNHHFLLCSSELVFLEGKQNSSKYMDNID